VMTTLAPGVTEAILHLRASFQSSFLVAHAREGFHKLNGLGLFVRPVTAAPGQMQLIVPGGILSWP
jgi:hypothetical protein